MSDVFGVTVWGKDWLRLAQPTSITRPNPALPRARTLARGDRVGNVVLGPGSITATVSVSDTSNFTVSLSFQVWDAAQSAVALEAIAGVSTGDLPDSVHADLARRGVPAGPKADSITATCECTQRTSPCVHVLAVYFESARRLDEQPRLAFDLRGVERQPARDASRIPIELIDPVGFYGHGTTVNDGHTEVHRAALDS